MLSVPPIWTWMSALQPIKTSYEIFCASAPSFVIWYNIASYLGIIRIKGGNSRDSNFLLSQFLSVTSWKYFSCWLWNCVCIVSQALPHPVADSLGLSQCQLGFLIPGPVMPLPGPQGAWPDFYSGICSLIPLHQLSSLVRTLCPLTLWQSNLLTLSSVVNTDATPKFPFKKDLTAQILGMLTATVSSFKSPRDCLSCTEMPSSKSCFCLRVPHLETDCAGSTWDNSERPL